MTGRLAQVSLRLVSIGDDRSFSSYSISILLLCFPSSLLCLVLLLVATSLPCSSTTCSLVHGVHDHKRLCAFEYSRQSKIQSSSRRVSLFAAIRKTCRVWPLRAAILTPERSLFSASVHVYARSRFPLRWASPRPTRGCVYMSCVDCYFLVRYRFEGPIRELYHGGRHD
jgi:hypothetical protein